MATLNTNGCYLCTGKIEPGDPDYMHSGGTHGSIHGVGALRLNEINVSIFGL
jgi:hypothetical protein